tara:strand:+ start:620 stop:778 length:159 start_codon:yes stop_codon:yes gene_type:complete
MAGSGKTRFHSTKGCSGYTLLEWAKKSEVDRGMRAGVPTELADRLKAFEREP